jgi:hypothetical protein
MAKARWVKKLVSKTRWNNWYSKIETYCFLREEFDKVWIGFLVADEIPDTYKPLTDMESLQVDNYRRAKNIRPFPCGEVESSEPQNRKEAIPELDKIKISLSQPKEPEEQEAKKEVGEKPFNEEPEEIFTEEQKKIIKEIPF